MNNRMQEVIYRWAGRASVVFDVLMSVKRLLRGGRRVSDGHDKTGLVQGSRPLVLELCSGDISLVRYESLAHAFWRAQEMTLIRRHQTFMESPLGDFGCGDGSFGASLFKKIDFGIDNDSEALEACRSQPVYVQTVLTTDSSVPLPSASLGSVLANSVLEHTLHPEIWLSEISRLLRPGGIFMMTVPLQGFARHLTRYFGGTQSRRINQEYHHYNLVEWDQWIRWLKAFDLEPLIIRQYQGPRFTFWYRMLRLVGVRGMGSFPFVQEWVWGRYRPALLEMIRESVDGVEDGANLFVVARRR